MSGNLGVAMVHYRTPEVAKRALTLLLAAAPDAHVVLVDAAPEAAFGAELVEEFPTVTFLPVPNHSYARSVNLGLKTLETPYLVQMNADVLVGPRTLTHLLNVIKREPRAGLVGPLALTRKGRPQHLGAPYAWYYMRLSSKRGLGDRAAGASVKVPWLSGCMQVMTRQAWEEAGGFDERFRFFNEDMDFSYRLRALGYTLHLVDSPVTHLGGASTPAHPAFHVEGRRGGMLFSERHKGPAFRAAQRAFLWAEARFGRALTKDPAVKHAHEEMLTLLRTGAWHESPFGETLDDRAPLGTPERAPATDQ